MKKFGSVVIVSLVILLAGGPVTRAEVSAASLADHTPATAAIFVGWAGSETLGPFYAASPLRGLVEGSNLPQVAGELLPKLWDQLAADPDRKPAVLDALHRSLTAIWHRPAAVYVTDIGTGADGNPVVHFGLLCDAGADADQLLGDFDTIVKSSHNAELKVDQSGSIIRLTDDSGPAAGPTLGQSNRFIAAMKPLQASPAVAIFVDVASIVHQADTTAGQSDFAREIWPKVRDALGIADLKSYAMTAGFEGQTWASDSAMIAPGPRTGLLAAIEPKPIDPALLSRIPGTAESVAVYNLDAAKLIDSVAAAMAVTPSSDKMFHQGTGVASLVLGRNFRRMILGPLGPQWIVCTDARSHATAVLNHPNDADTASDSMVSAAFGLINTANAQMPAASITAVQKTVDGIDLTSAKSDQIERFVGTPTFAAKDGILYFGNSPESVVTSAKMKPVSEANDFLHDSNFAAALYRLQVPSAGSIDYCNIPLTAPRAYERLKSEEAALDSLAKRASVDLLKIELPPIAKILPQLSPAISVSWADADGIYTKSISPFPGSAVLLGDPQESVVSLGTVSLAAGILMPALVRARAAANLTWTMESERQILLAMIVWSMNHQGTCPPDLGSLVSTPQVTDLKVFFHHNSSVTVPPAITNGTAEQKAAWVNEHAEFTLLVAGKQMSTFADASKVAALIEKNPTGPTKVAVGFVDGHVEACTAKTAKKYVDGAGQ